MCFHFFFLILTMFPNYTLSPSADRNLLWAEKPWHFKAWSRHTIESCLFVYACVMTLLIRASYACLLINEFLLSFCLLVYLFCGLSKCHRRQKQQLAPLANAAAWVRGQRQLCCWEKCQACLTETWKWTYKIRSKLFFSIVFIQITASNVTRLPASG